MRKKIRDRRPTRVPLMIRSDDMEPKEYERLKDAANDIKVPRETLIYAYENRRSLMNRRKGELRSFTLSGLSHNIYPTWIDITTSEHNQEATLCFQGLTSALLIQRVSQDHLLGNTSHDYWGLQ